MQLVLWVLLGVYTNSKCKLKVRRGLKGPRVRVAMHNSINVVATYHLVMASGQASIVIQDKLDMWVHQHRVVRSVTDQVNIANGAIRHRVLEFRARV